MKAAPLRSRPLSTVGVVVLLLVSAIGCDSFVEGVDDPVHRIPDESLNDESQIPFIAAGVWNEFGVSYGRLATRAGWLSDELTTGPTNRNFSNKRIDQGFIPFDEPQTLLLQGRMGWYRALADGLIKRIDEIDFVNPEVRRQGLFTGHLHAAIARYLIASFSGLTEREGGGVITINPEEPGPFIPSETLYRHALDHLEVARTYALETDVPIINTIEARIHLFLDDFAAARNAAASGLSVGDASFDALYTTTYPNFNQWVGVSSRLSLGWTFESDYGEFIRADSAERNRIPVFTVLGPDSTMLYVQDRYSDLTSPQPFATWQENELILAEIDLRDGDAGSALSRVNTVREFWGISPLDSFDMDALELERRKELWGTGLRLIDQRRFHHWHLGPDTWQYFPIPQSERDINPNID